jgi:hypothetical protein
MEKNLPSTFIERIMAGMDGAVASIWISQFTWIQGIPDQEALIRALGDLVRETARLNLAWDVSNASWRVSNRAESAIRACLCWSDQPAESGTITNRVIGESINLAVDIPLRVIAQRILSNAVESDLWLLGFQIHHAIGDGRALMYLLDRFMQHLAGKFEGNHPVEAAVFSDKSAILAALGPGRAPVTLLSSRNRVFANRAHALSRTGDAYGVPTLCSLRVPRLAAVLSPATVFYSSILAAMLLHEREFPGATLQKFPFRLRVPVDLRRAVGIRNRTLENVCSVIPVEFLPAEVSHAMDQGPKALHTLVERRFLEASQQGKSLATLLECWLAEKIAGPKGLRTGAARDLISDVRSNTMVVTYLGRTDTYLRYCPFPVKAVASQTATWGANGFLFRSCLHLNLTSFSGIWSKDRRTRFVEHISRWIRSSYGVNPEVIVD